MSQDMVRDLTATWTEITHVFDRGGFCYPVEPGTFETFDDQTVLWMDARSGLIQRAQMTDLLAYETPEGQFPAADFLTGWDENGWPLEDVEVDQTAPDFGGAL